MHRSVLQVRPRNNPDAMPYSPQRDLATLYVPAMREAIWGLDRVNWRPFFQEWMVAAGVTEESLADGVKRFVEAHKLFTGHSEIKEPNDAFVQSGFAALSPAVQAAIYYRLGEVIAAGFFIALRDVTLQGDTPPNVNEISMMVAAGRRMAERLTGQLKPEQSTEDALQERLEGLLIEIEERKARHARLHEIIHQKDAELRAMADKLHAASCEHGADIQRIQQRNLWTTLQDWWVWGAHTFSRSRK
jgi:hypothetical protein